ncbi:hypothetical protein GOP47_0006136 [Adiantum capillus-veneris]|uniref:Succinate dehydrogenase subunit 6, mitochondrial n=1 Tax=Adiantum capillus-veneris TaxID=13818 RepID=A0A9D4V299_ADICA|nr:hypothetical protein GOP47_0006136 [Adiantum capillus-veneris]
MGEEEGPKKKPWWAIDKEAWRQHFHLIFDMASVAKGRDKPLKPWSDADVEEFIHSDPVYGPQLKLVREAAKISAGGAVVGGLTTTAVVARYSRAPHGLLLSLVAGAIVGWSVAEEGARLAYGLHKIDCMDTNLRFLDWWKHKTEG